MKYNQDFPEPSFECTPKLHRMAADGERPEPTRYFEILLTRNRARLVQLLLHGSLSDLWVFRLKSGVS